MGCQPGTVKSQAARALAALRPLLRPEMAKGSRSLASVVAAGCGSRIVRDTWLIISAHPASPSRAAEALFLDRRGPRARL